MAQPVSIKAMLEGFEQQGELDLMFVNRETGEVRVMPQDLIGCAEEGEEPADLPAWQVEMWKEALEIIASRDWLRAPSAFDIHEWQIMRDFAHTVSSERVRDELSQAIHGRGAFRAFKAVVGRHHLFDDWNQFRENTLRDIAIEWSEGKDLAWRD